MRLEGNNYYFINIVYSFTEVLALTSAADSSKDEDIMFKILLTQACKQNYYYLCLDI